MAEKRRLPVVQTPQNSSNEAEPSVVIWTSVGIVFAFVVWLPLAYLAARLGARLVLGEHADASAEALALRLADMPEAARTRMQSQVAALQLAALALAHAGAGALVARFGRATTLRSWTAVGVATASIAAVLTLVGGGFSLGALVPIPLAAAASAGGGWLMRRFARG